MTWGQWSLSIRPPIFKKVISQGAQEYSISLALDDSVLPETAVAENFEITTADTKQALKIADAFYMPQEGTVNITLQSAELTSPDCTVRMLGGLKYLDGTTAEGEKTESVAQSYPLNMFGVSIQSLTLWQQGKQVVLPEASEALTVRVRIINESPKAETKNLRIYSSGLANTTLAEQEVTIAALSTKIVEVKLQNGLDERTGGAVRAELN